jgi:hypothetical protein
MKKTFFVEIVFNNKDKFINHNRYLRGIVTAKDKAEAETKVVNHFKHLYTAGDAGVFEVQCNWQVKIPTREIIEAHWRAATRAQGSIPINAPGYEIKTIGYRHFQLDSTKKEVMASWDYCNIDWAEPTVHYDISKGGYVVSMQSYMAMPSPFVFFKGVTRETYKKALKFVKDNTFQGDYYIPFKG